METRLKIYRGILLMACLLGFAGSTFAQDSPTEKISPFSAGVDLMSRYIWRGLNPGGNTPSIQPSLKYSKGIFTVGAWGAYSIGSQYGQEADLYATLTPVSLFSFTLTDYFFPNETAGAAMRNKYFNYKKDETGHVFEVSATFNGTESLPLSLLLAMNVYGADAKDANGKICHTPYAELSYSANVNGVGIKPFVGAVLSKPDEGTTGYYCQKEAGIVNLGVTASKKLTINKDFSIPVTSSLITNPSAGNIYLVFGFSF
ncbi:MAG: TorF family putative porin [Bacteroidota bacterium]|nr:TorF family putative porin [Bacteroidota bacterium]MDP4225269.1 TorF family putative porin [Bacteroidota bacterium]MDP4273040.1 TorF family putative porin [Bacteroidota bacterium]